VARAALWLCAGCIRNRKDGNWGNSVLCNRDWPTKYGMGGPLSQFLWLFLALALEQQRGWNKDTELIKPAHFCCNLQVPQWGSPWHVPRFSAHSKINLATFCLGEHLWQVTAWEYHISTLFGALYSPYMGHIWFEFCVRHPYWLRLNSSYLSVTGHGRL
jgi:hypothetical protein